MQASKLLAAALFSFNLVACVVGDNETIEDPEQLGTIVDPLPDDLPDLEPDDRRVIIIGGYEVQLEDIPHGQDLVPDQPRANPLDKQAKLEPQP